LQNIPGRHGQSWTPAVIVRVVVRDQHAERIVASCEVEHHERARCLSLRFGQSTQEGRRREAVGEGRDAALHERSSGMLHWNLYTNWYCGAARMMCASP